MTIMAHGKITLLRSLYSSYNSCIVGCFVPASYASFRLTDQVMTRICNESKHYENTSSFMMEMREMAYILQHVTDDSLVLIDELGRGNVFVDACDARCNALILKPGTSIQDGLGITFALSEELIKTKVSLTGYIKCLKKHMQQFFDRPMSFLLPTFKS
jgi:DNA mismatch repair protein MSH4